MSSVTDHQSESNDVLCNLDINGIATITLNRKEKRNAFDDVMIKSLTRHLTDLADNFAVRCLILRANGEHFSAGADLDWMRSMADQSRQENLADATQLADLLALLDAFPHPTIAVVQGSAYGGALGLICCCDIAIANFDASFCLSEVKLGLIPATIGPYVIRAIGSRQARRYMLTAESIDATTAKQMGLVHSTVTLSPMSKLTKISVQDRSIAALNHELSHFTEAILANSPLALSKAKALCQLADNHEINALLIDKTIHEIADIRVSKQGQEGVNAFFEKRSPSWITNRDNDGSNWDTNE